MKNLFQIGDVIYGYCNGYFGNNDYDRKICIMVANKYVVFQYLDGDMEGFATVLNKTDRLDISIVSEWKKDSFENLI